MQRTSWTFLDVNEIDKSVQKKTILMKFIHSSSKPFDTGQFTQIIADALVDVFILKHYLVEIIFSVISSVTFIFSSTCNKFIENVDWIVLNVVLSNFL